MDGKDRPLEWAQDAGGPLVVLSRNFVPDTARRVEKGTLYTLDETAESGTQTVCRQGYTAGAQKETRGAASRSPPRAAAPRRARASCLSLL